jgi:hypothetical protein|nr:MAG TPA: hypothetical protein [Caudoviricetes sp.]
MAIYRIEMDETVVFHHAIEFETELSENKVDRILDDIQSNSSIYDVANGLKERGFTILEGDEDELGETVEMKISTLEEI